MIPSHFKVLLLHLKPLVQLGHAVGASTTVTHVHGQPRQSQAAHNV